MERKIRLQLPQPPNFIILDIPTNISKPSVGLNQGFKEKPSIPIESLSESEAEEFAEEIKPKFLEHYRYRKSHPTQSPLQRQLNP